MKSLHFHSSYYLDIHLAVWHLGFFFFCIKSAYALVVEARLRFSCKQWAIRGYDRMIDGSVSKWFCLWGREGVLLWDSVFLLGNQITCADGQWKTSFPWLDWVEEFAEWHCFGQNAMQYVIKLNLEASRRLEWLPMKTYFTPTSFFFFFFLGNCEQHNEFVHKALEHILSN